MVNLYKKYLATLLLIALLTPIFFLGVPRKATADAIPVMEIGVSLTQQILTAAKSVFIAAKSAITAAATVAIEVSTGSLATKEYVLDLIAWTVAKAAAHSLMQSVIDWVRNGFDGGVGPLFITNFESYLTNAADQATGLFMQEYMSDGVLNTICSPFRPQLTLALQTAASSRNQYQQRVGCTLSTIANNAQNFTSQINNGSWDNWIKVATIPQNNFYGNYLLQMDELYSRQEAAVNNATTKSIYNQGFLSVETCDENDKVYDYDTNAYVGCLNPKVTSPGKWIEDQLAVHTTSAIRSLELADEIDELVGALVAQLLNWVTNGISGSESTDVPYYADTPGDWRPAVNLQVNNSDTATIPPNTTSSVTFSWTSTGANSCTASGGNWRGEKQTSGSETVVNPLAGAGSETFTLTCVSNLGAQGFDTVTVRTTTGEGAPPGSGGSSTTTPPSGPPSTTEFFEWNTTAQMARSQVTFLPRQTKNFIFRVPENAISFIITFYTEGVAVEGSFRIPLKPDGTHYRLNPVISSNRVVEDENGTLLTGFIAYNEGAIRINGWGGGTGIFAQGESLYPGDFILSMTAVDNIGGNPVTPDGWGYLVSEIHYPPNTTVLPWGVTPITPNFGNILFQSGETKNFILRVPQNSRGFNFFTYGTLMPFGATYRIRLPLKPNGERYRIRTGIPSSWLITEVNTETTITTTIGSNNGITFRTMDLIDTIQDPIIYQGDYLVTITTETAAGYTGYLQMRTELIP